jgi:hypothetical protein
MVETMLSHHRTLAVHHIGHFFHPLAIAQRKDSFFASGDATNASRLNELFEIPKKF